MKKCPFRFGLPNAQCIEGGCVSWVLLYYADAGQTAVMGCYYFNAKEI